MHEEQSIKDRISATYEKKKVREKSRECNKHKPHPFPYTKRKRKQTKPNKRKSNKRTKGTKISSLFPKRGNCNAKRTDITKTRLFKCIENFTTQKEKLSDKKNLYFSHFCSKHRLWVLVRTSNEYPQSMFLSRNKKNNVYPCKPQFYYIKVGFKGVEII